MVCYLARSGEGIERYAETEWDILDMPVATISRQAEYMDSDHVHPDALRENASRLEQGYWVKGETLPKKVLWANGPKPVPDVLPRFVVSPRFRELVEQFEPKVHQFVPVEIYKSRAGEPVVTYYWFIVGQRLESVDRDHTTYHWRPSRHNPNDGHWLDEIMDTKTFEFTRVPNARLVFSNDKTQGHHIWHDPHVLTGGNRLCSDEFAAAVLSGKFTGVDVAQRDSI